MLKTVHLRLEAAAEEVDTQVLLVVIEVPVMEDQVLLYLNFL